MPGLSASTPEWILGTATWSTCDERSDPVARSDRRALRPRPDIVVASAGTDDCDQTLPSLVAGRIRSHGLDGSRHRRRTLTRDMLRPGVTVIGMSTDHCEFIAGHFGRHDVPLFTQAYGLEPAPVLDLHEAIPDHEHKPVETAAYVRDTIDRILGWTPHLANRLVRFMGGERWRPSDDIDGETLGPTGKSALRSPSGSPGLPSRMPPWQPSFRSR